MKYLSDDVLGHLCAVLDEPDLEGTKYRLVGLLGRGGMGTVHAVHDVELGRQVALKVSNEAVSSELASLLRHEARILASLEHPGIVPVHDVGVLPDGRLFYVMKLVRGERLDVWIGKQPAFGSSLRLFQRICEAVAFAHARGVIHRDLKPENVMVGELGEALVMDWGIAKVLASDRSLPATVAEPEGSVLGTAGYMAPEQARGDIAALDPRTDVYSLGATLAFVLAGRDPPPPLASICEKAMARDPDDRYPSARAMADDVGAFLDGAAVTAHRETLAERAARFASRHRVVLTLLGAYLMMRVVLALLSR